MSFDTFKRKPISSKAVLMEFGISTGQLFFINEEPGIWRYQWDVAVETTANFENGAFCYGCFEQECTELFTNNKPEILIVSVIVNGESYTEVSNLTNLRATNKSFWFDPASDVVHIHFDNFDPPWIFSSIKLGVSVNIANKAGVYDGLLYESRLKKLSPLSAKADPLFYGVLGFGGTTATIENSDGEYDQLSALDLFGQTVNILYGEEGDDYANFQRVFSGIVDDFALDYESLTIKIRDKRKSLLRSVPTSIYDGTTYPFIKPENKNKPIPIAYGQLENIPVVCTNEEESAPASYQFKICETIHHDIQAINAVRVDDVAKTPTATSLTEATFELSTADYTPGQAVTADVDGYEDPGGNLIENALYVLQDILDNYAGIPFTTDNFDVIEYLAARAEAPDIAFFQNEATESRAAIEKICLSLNGILIARNDGRFTFRYFHASGIKQDEININEFLKTPAIRYPSDQYISTAVVEYAKNHGAGTVLSYVDDTLEDTLFNRFSVSNRYQVETLLKSEADAQALASNLLEEYAVISQWVEISVPIEFVELVLLDFVTIQLDRIRGTWFGDIDERVYGIRQDVMNGTIGLTLRRAVGELLTEVYTQGEFYGDNYYQDGKYAVTKTEEVLQ